MIHYHHQIFEDYIGARYRFENIGDAIPMHIHGDDLSHDVTVEKGSVRVNERIVHQGETYKFNSHEPHEVVALEPNTVTFHVYDVFPEHYLNLPTECLEGTIGA